MILPITNSQTKEETTLNDNTTKPMRQVIRIGEGETGGHLDEMVRGTIEETLNSLPEAKAN